MNKKPEKLDANVFKNLPENSPWRIIFLRQQSKLFSSIREAIIDYKEDREKEIRNLYTLKKDSEMETQKLHILGEIKTILDSNFEDISLEISNHE